MSQLITITKSNLNNQNANAVSARELHSGLELKKDFTDWVKKMHKTTTKHFNFYEVK